MGLNLSFVLCIVNNITFYDKLKKKKLLNNIRVKIVCTSIGFQTIKLYYKKVRLDNILIFYLKFNESNIIDWFNIICVRYRLMLVNASMPNFDITEYQYYFLTVS